MRIFERLQYFTAVALLGVHFLGNNPEFVQVSLHFLLLFIVVGIWREGVRFSQLPFVATFLFLRTVFSLTGYFIYWPFLICTIFSISCWFLFGESDYSKFKPSGKYRVGYREFTTKELGNDCSIFYPAENDDSGEFEVPFFPYG